MPFKCVVEKLTHEVANLKKALEIKSAIIKDSIEDEDAIKESLKPFLSEFELYGDSYGVPSAPICVDTFIEKYITMKRERDVAMKALVILSNRISEWSIIDCDCKRVALKMAEAELNNASSVSHPVVITNPVSVLSSTATDNIYETADKIINDIERAHKNAANSKLVFKKEDDNG